MIWPIIKHLKSAQRRIFTILMSYFTVHKNLWKSYLINRLMKIQRKRAYICCYFDKTSLISHVDHSLICFVWFDLVFQKVFLYFDTGLLPSCMSYMEVCADMLSEHYHLTLCQQVTIQESNLDLWSFSTSC